MGLCVVMMTSSHQLKPRGGVLRPLPKNKVQKRPKKAETLSAALLVAGTAIGAGILALPSATFEAGFVPSTLTLLVAWAFTSCSGLLIAEARIRSQANGGFTATIGGSLGKGAAALASVLMASVCYAIMVAYIAEGGSLLGSPAALAFGLGAFLTVAPSKVIDVVNNFFVVVVLASFFALTGVGASRVSPARLVSRMQWHKAPSSLPICAVSLVYHTVVPHVVDKLDDDPKAITTALVGGSLVPLAMFLVWNAVILGAVDAYVNDPVAVLRSASDSPILGPSVWTFSFFAIVTSFIGLFFGLRSFLADLLRPLENHPTILGLGIVVPPLIFAILCKNAFLTALDLAGIFVTVLFGVLPTLAVLKLRRRSRSSSSLTLPGGTPILVLHLALSAFIIADGLLRQFG